MDSTSLHMTRSVRGLINRERLSTRIDFKDVRRGAGEVGDHLRVPEERSTDTGFAHVGQEPRQPRVSSGCSHTQPPSSMPEKNFPSKTVTAGKMCISTQVREGTSRVSINEGQDSSAGALRWYVAPTNLPPRDQGRSTTAASASGASGHAASTLPTFGCSENDGPLMRGRLELARQRQQQERKPLLQLSPHVVDVSTFHQRQEELPRLSTCVAKQPHHAHQLGGSVDGIEAVPEKLIAEEPFPEIPATVLGHPQPSVRTSGSGYILRSPSPLGLLPSSGAQQYLASNVHQQHTPTNGTRRAGKTGIREGIVTHRPNSALPSVTCPRVDQPQRLRWTSQAEGPSNGVTFTECAFLTPGEMAHRPYAAGGPRTRRPLGLLAHSLCSPRKTEYRDCHRKGEPLQDQGLLRTPLSSLPEITHLSGKHDQRNGQQQLQKTKFQQPTHTAQQLRKVLAQQEDPHQPAPSDSHAGLVPSYSVLFTSKTQKQQHQGLTVCPQLHPLQQQQQQLVRLQQQQPRVLAQQSQAPGACQSLQTCTPQTQLNCRLDERGLTHPPEGYTPSGAENLWRERHGSGAHETQKIHSQQMQLHTSGRQQQDMQQDPSFAAGKTSRLPEQQCTAEAEQYSSVGRSKIKPQQQQSSSRGYPDVLQQHHHRTHAFLAAPLPQLGPCGTAHNEAVSGSTGGNFLRRVHHRNLASDQMEERGGREVDSPTLQNEVPSQATNPVPGDFLMNSLRCCQTLSTKYYESMSDNDQEGEPVEPFVDHTMLLSSRPADSPDSGNLRALCREPSTEHVAGSIAPLDTLPTVQIHSPNRQDRGSKSLHPYQMGAPGDVCQNMQLLCSQQVADVSPSKERPCFGTPPGVPGPYLEDEEDPRYETAASMEQGKRESCDGPRCEPNDLPTEAATPRLPETPDETATRRSMAMSTTQSDLESGVSLSSVQHQNHFPNAQSTHLCGVMPAATSLELKDSTAAVSHTLPVEFQGTTCCIRRPAQTQRTSPVHQGDDGIRGPSSHSSFSGLYAASPGSSLPQALSGSPAEGGTPQSLPPAVQLKLVPMKFSESACREEACYGGLPELIKFFSPDQQLAHTYPRSYLRRTQRPAREEAGAGEGVSVLEPLSCPQLSVIPHPGPETQQVLALQEQHVQQTQQVYYLPQQRENEGYQNDSQQYQQQQQQRSQVDNSPEVCLPPSFPFRSEKGSADQLLDQNAADSRSFSFDCPCDTAGASDADWYMFVVKLLIEHNALSPAILSPDGGVREWLIPRGFSFLPTLKNKASCLCL